MDNLRVATFNVRGLRDSAKRRDLFFYFHKKKFDILLLQETHSSKSQEFWWSSTWGSKIWFSHGETNSKGVAILFNKRCECVVHNVISSDDGRYLLLYVTVNKKKFLISNIYAPNEDCPIFFQKVFREIERFHPDYFMIGGDFNFALNIVEDRFGSPVTMTKVRNG